MLGLAAALSLPCAGIAQETPPADAPETASDSASDSASEPAPTGPARPATQADDPVNVETPIFPEDMRLRDAFRLRVESHFVPNTTFGDLESTLYRPNLRGRITLPIGRRAVVVLTPRWESSRYNVDGAPELGLSDGGVEVLHTVSVGLQGAYALEIERKLFSEKERWSVLAGVIWASTWEGNTFSDGMRFAGTLAVGYETDQLRLAIGAGVSSRLTGGGARVLPIVSIRWSPLDKLTLRNRGRGLQIEYRLTDRFKIFTAGYFVTRRFRLEERFGIASAAAELQDKQVLAGVGFEWRISRYLRLNIEGGVVGWYQLRVRDEDRNTLGSFQGDPTGYVDISIELRP